ncbi:hypothetical protein RFI_36588 [Reticulomyxa filosa]|uniref:Uncharacterized protein n=1 Tax=Reticulomyxa filosa TaxID=46433 RepID=X6LI88_RETFI|nr:hypothetical protein RFI_36588 [Reticulomyxa filosa]|eukprot:ETO00852.1 hypothetical protein RFI_36588 [Reticulomyxa filosa]
MILFHKSTVVKIKYYEDNNKILYRKLNVCDDIAHFCSYAYVCVNSLILNIHIIGGNNGKKVVAKHITATINQWSIEDEMKVKKIMKLNLNNCCYDKHKENNNFFIC